MNMAFREKKPVKETCIQTACFFLPFFEAGEWRAGEKSPWILVRKLKNITPDHVRTLAEYAYNTLLRCANTMEALQDIHNDWTITVKKKGIWMETQTMNYEDILPKLKERGISENDFELYSEYTRKWGML